LSDEIRDMYIPWGSYCSFQFIGADTKTSNFSTGLNSLQ